MSDEIKKNPIGFSLITERALTFLWLLCFLALYICFKAAFGILTCDDAYITLGHARSWIDGLGPVMSQRNPVSATSTPLHTAQLAFAALLFRGADLGALAYFIDVLWDLAALYFLYRIAAGLLGLSRPASLLAVGAHALSVLALSVSAYGMETSMYVALALGGAWFRFAPARPGARDGIRPGFLAVCFLAPLARPEGALLPAVLILAGLRRDGPRRAFAYAGAAAAGLALFFGFYLMAYGHPLPHSVVAKRLEMRLGLSQSLSSWALNVFYKGPCLGGTMAVTLGNAAAIVAAIAGFARRRAPGLSLITHNFELPTILRLFAWPAAYFLFFILTRSSYVWSTWYYLPVMPFAALFIAAGIDRLLEGRLGGRAVWILLFAFLACAAAQTFRQELPRKHRLAHHAREGRYREAARLLDSASAGSPAPVVMFDEVGALAYFSHAKILDTHGLLSPEALPYLSGPPDDWKRMRAMRERFAPDWIMAARPAESEGRLRPGEEGIYAGYQVTQGLRYPGNPFVIEMWRRSGP